MCPRTAVGIWRADYHFKDELMPLKISSIGWLRNKVAVNRFTNARNSNIEHDLLIASKMGIMSRIVNISVNC